MRRPSLAIVVVVAATLTIAACGASPRSPTGAGAGTAAPTTAQVPTSTPAPPTSTLALPTTPPTTIATTTRPEPAPGCPATGRGAVVDRARQRAWLCDGPLRHGDELLVTTAITQPLPGTYPVFAKDRLTTSTFGGHFSYLDDFVAFTKGLRTGARIAFHAVPRLPKGGYVQAFETLGDLDRRGDSSGCIRVLPEQAAQIWDWLSVGDPVTVIS